MEDLENLRKLLQDHGFDADELLKEPAVPFERDEKAIEDIREYVISKGFGLLPGGMTGTDKCTDFVSLGVSYACQKYADAKEMFDGLIAAFLIFVEMHPEGMKVTKDYETKYGDVYFESLPNGQTTVCFFFEK